MAGQVTVCCSKTVSSPGIGDGIWGEALAPKSGSKDGPRCDGNTEGAVGGYNRSCFRFCAELSFGSMEKELPETLPELQRYRKHLAMEMLWLQQAIASRKNVRASCFLLIVWVGVHMCAHSECWMELPGVWSCNAELIAPVEFRFER